MDALILEDNNKPSVEYVYNHAEAIIDNVIRNNLGLSQDKLEELICQRLQKSVTQRFLKKLALDNEIIEQQAILEALRKKHGELNKKLGTYKLLTTK